MKPTLFRYSGIIHMSHAKYNKKRVKIITTVTHLYIANFNESTLHCVLTVKENTEKRCLRY